MAEQDTSVVGAEDAPQPDPLKAAEAKRDARKAANAKIANAALAVDIEAIDAIEQQLGDTNVATIRVGYVPGLPSAVAVRCPKPSEIKRFRDLTAPHKDKRNNDVRPDATGPTEQLARVCLVYPDPATFERICEARGALASQLGKEAIKLAVGVEESEGKD